MTPFNQAWQILKEIIDDEYPYYQSADIPPKYGEGGSFRNPLPQDLQDAKKARIEALTNFIMTNAYSYDKALLEQVVASWQELNRLDDYAGESTWPEYKDAQADLEWMELEEVYGAGNL